MSIFQFPQSSIPFDLQVAQGKIPGYTALFRSAYTDQCSTTTTTLQPTGNLYAFPASASTMTLSSTSTADVGQVVLIEGLNSSFVEISETKSLNGQTPVTTTNSYYRINRMIVVSLDGPGVNPAGTIWLGTGAVTAGVPTNKYRAITAGDNASMSTVYTVPAGKTYYITSGSISSATTTSSKYINAIFYTRINGIVYVTAHISVSSSFQNLPYTVPVALPAGADTWVNVTSSSGTDSVAATVNGYLVTNGY